MNQLERAKYIQQLQQKVQKQDYEHKMNMAKHNQISSDINTLVVFQQNNMRNGICSMLNGVNIL